MVKKYFAWLLMLGVAELVASLLIWPGIPTTDWVGAPLPFWAYGVWRLKYWSLSCAASSLLWVVRHAYRCGAFSIPPRLFGVALALAIEISTSVAWWWKVHRHEPSQVYLPWHSFTEYFWDHFIWWALVLIVGQTVSYFFLKLRGSPPTVVGLLADPSVREKAVSRGTSSGERVGFKAIFTRMKSSTPMNKLLCFVKRGPTTGSWG